MTKTLKAQIINPGCIVFQDSENEYGLNSVSHVEITEITKTVMEVSEYLASISHTHGSYFENYNEPNIIILPTSWYVIIKKYNEHARDNDPLVIYTPFGKLRMVRGFTENYSFAQENY